jgi:hypothetical protein
MNDKDDNISTSIDSQNQDSKNQINRGKLNEKNILNEIKNISEIIGKLNDQISNCEKIGNKKETNNLNINNNSSNNKEKSLTNVDKINSKENLIQGNSFEVNKKEDNINCFIIIISETNNINEKISTLKNDYKNIFIDVIIPISMSLDDAYSYPTIVSITSIMINSNSNTKNIFNIMHPSEFKIENKNKLKNLEKKYNRCVIYLIDMKDKYKDAWKSGRVTIPAYYRLSLPMILPYIDKILWLDGDTLIFTDLKEMYDIDMKGYYYKGFLDSVPNDVDVFTTENDHAICSGIMIINLDELRKDDMMNKIHKFMEEKKKYFLKKNIMIKLL